MPNIPQCTGRPLLPTKLSAPNRRLRNLVSGLIDGRLELGAHIEHNKLWKKYLCSNKWNALEAICFSALVPHLLVMSFKWLKEKRKKMKKPNFLLTALWLKGEHFQLACVRLTWCGGPSTVNFRSVGYTSVSTAKSLTALGWHYHPA